MGKSIAFLLGTKVGRFDRSTMYRGVWVRLRIHGFEWKTGHHTVDRQDLFDYHTGKVSDFHSDQEMHFERVFFIRTLNFKENFPQALKCS